MELLIAEQRAFVFADQLTPERAKERAWTAKMSAFGNLQKLLFRPKEDDLQIIGNEQRYEPFWHVVCETQQDYERHAKFTISGMRPEVKRVTIDGLDSLPITVDSGHFLLPGVEHCEEEAKLEEFYDGVTGALQNYRPYLSFSSTQITDLGEFQMPNALIVPPEIRASSVVRQVLAKMMKAVQADVIHKDLVEVTAIDLYLRPIHAFEYRWVSKDKRTVLEFDGVTGEMRQGSKVLGQPLSQVLTPELLFDVGADAVDLLVPGGGIAMKVGRALVSKTKSSSTPSTP